MCTEELLRFRTEDFPHVPARNLGFHPYPQASSQRERNLQASSQRERNLQASSQRERNLQASSQRERNLPTPTPNVPTRIVIRR